MARQQQQRRQQEQPETSGLSQLTCDTIGDLDDGLARLAIDEQIRTAVNDIENRGEDGKPRKVTIELSISKLDTNAVAIDVSSKASIPPMKLKKTIAQSRPAGKGETTVNFRADNGRRPDQPTIPFDNETDKDGD